MTPRQGAGVSFSVLLVALVLAWQITKPEDRGHRPRVKPVVTAAPVSESVPAARRASRPASRPASRLARRPRSRTEGPPRITGRVVTNRQRAPATGAQVKLVFSYPGAPREITSIVATGPDGRFSAAIPAGTEPGSAAIEVTDAKGFGKEDLDVFPPFAGTTDVGDVELSSMRKLWFHVTTADLAPIGDACAVGKPGPGVIVRTDADGNGWVESDAGIESVRFVAPGFEPTEVAVPPGEESLEVRLRPAVTAKIRITTSAGEPAAGGGGAINVSIETSPDAYLVQPGDPFWSPLGNTRVVGRSTRVSPRPHGVPGDLLTFHSNPITLGPLRQGTHLTILVTEIFKGRTFRKETDLTSAGPQDVEFVLPGEYGRLAGRVLDATGKPVVGATVTLLKKPAMRATDGKGEFSFGAVPAGLYGLQVSSPAHACWRLAEHPVEPDAKPLAITMESGVTVTVTVLDQEGMPFHGAGVRALDRSGRTDAKGRVKLPHLPVGLVSFEATSGGLMKVLERHTSTPDVTIQLQENEDR